jgi:hypothetical protein
MTMRTIGPIQRLCVEEPADGIYNLCYRENMPILAVGTPRDGWSRPLDKGDVEMALQAAADCCTLSNCRTLGNVTERHRMACESKTYTNQCTTSLLPNGKRMWDSTIT